MVTAAVTTLSVGQLLDGPAITVCYNAVEIARLMGVAGLTLWIVTLVEAALAQSYPLWQLGESNPCGGSCYLHCNLLALTSQYIRVAWMEF